MQSDTEEREPREDGRPSAWRSHWNHARVWVPALAVTAVAVMAMLAAVMVTQAGPEPADPARPTAAVSRHDRLSQPGKTQVAASACRDCGVVESVVMLERKTQAYPVAYQVRIRMDDGTVRTVEQPGAPAAGSRVMVAGGSARPIGGRAAPG